MPVHDVAQRGFGSTAEVYERSRPGYPTQAVSWLAKHCRLVAGARVCDLAAGTGKLTRLLHGTGLRLVAVEPVGGMARVLRREVPGVAVVAATAERLPFGNATFDAVTVAQAFHWFEPEATLFELRRVLRPGGRLGLIWNARDRSVGWVDALWSVMDRVEKRAPWRDHEHWRGSAFAVQRWFGPLHEATFHHEQILDADGVVARFAGVSHLAVLPEVERRRYLDEVREILGSHPALAGRDRFAIPYRVDAYWCERSR
jgi:ubiquinone/menaquinone biosynthesis C-methylase UbiE